MTEAYETVTRVELLASLLAGAWRESVPASDCSKEELELIAPLLMETGAAALAWRRVSHSELNSSTAASELRDVYRLYKLLAVIYERDLAEIFKLLRSHSIEPVLVKGWAIARHYAEPSVRPCGDIDLCVRKAEYAKALAVLKGNMKSSQSVDLHRGFRLLDNRSFDELYSRSNLVELEGEAVRVLSSEDHLRVLCYHFLREGGWRPIWLCDIAVALESRPAGFDWDLCLGEKGRGGAFVACAIGLAHRLIGAEVTDTPSAVRDAKMPEWLVPSVLKEWEARTMSQRHRSPMTSAFSRPLHTLRGLRHRWPTPVEATIALNGPFNEMPRLPFQIGNYLFRTARYVAHLPRMLRNAR